MNHDVNKIIDNLSHTWAQDLIIAKKEVAILAEEKRLLKEELELVKNQLKEQENAE